MICPRKKDEESHAPEHANRAFFNSCLTGACPVMADVINSSTVIHHFLALLDFAALLQVPDNEYSLHGFEEEVGMRLIMSCCMR
jgi:hypothetical protein